MLIGRISSRVGDDFFGIGDTAAIFQHFGTSAFSIDNLNKYDKGSDKKIAAFLYKIVGRSDERLEEGIRMMM